MSHILRWMSAPGMQADLFGVGSSARLLVEIKRNSARLFERLAIELQPFGHTAFR
jgi:hypothetical protein